MGRGVNEVPVGEYYRFHNDRLIPLGGGSTHARDLYKLDCLWQAGIAHFWEAEKEEEQRNARRSMKAILSCTRNLRLDARKEEEQRNARRSRKAILSRTRNLDGAGLRSG